MSVMANKNGQKTEMAVAGGDISYDVFETGAGSRFSFLFSGSRLVWRNIVIGCFFLLTTWCFSSVPVLEREVNLVLQNEKITSALEKIQAQAGFVFSYQPALLNDIGPVSVQLKKKTVREALSLLLPKHIMYKSRDNYVILKEKPKDDNQKKKEISGYVYDKTTNEKVANVTLYDKKTLNAVTTDEYGYYKITVPNDDLLLSVNKDTYADTVIRLDAKTDTSIMNIPIDLEKKVYTNTDSLKWKETVSAVNEFSKKLVQNFKGFINTVNVKDTISRNFQVSFLPYVGTNHRLSGNVYNKWSLNILGGYARGLHGFEVGGLFNIDKENVNGCQMAGLFNVVGDSAKGSQFAGLMNVSGKSASGFQAAGLLNVNEGTAKGFQAAGLMNISERTKGTSVCALMNISRSVEGVQVAGLANVQDSLHGAVIAGLFNVTDHGTGATQLSGLFNINEKGSSYLQIAGLFNKTSHLKGTQIALFNFSDSVSGVPIGLMSFAKTGIHQFEISGDEVFPVNLGFRTGVQAFYNTLSVGIKPGSSGPYWQAGYGIGTSLRLNGKLRGDLQLSVHHVSRGEFYFAANEIYKSYLGIEFRPGKKFSVAAGPTFNVFVSDTYISDYAADFQDLVPRPLYDETSSYGYNVKCWIGGRISLRFF